MISTIEAAPVAFGAGSDIDVRGIPSHADIVRPMYDLSYEGQMKGRSEFPDEVADLGKERAENFNLVVSTMRAALGAVGAINAYPVAALHSMEKRLNELVLVDVSEDGVIDIPENRNGIAFLPMSDHSQENYRLGASFWTPGTAWWARIESAYEQYRDAKAHDTFLADRALVEEHLLKYDPSDFPLDSLENGSAYMQDNRLRFDLVKQNSYNHITEHGFLRTWQARLLCCMQMPKNSDAIPQILSHQFAHMEQLDQDIFCDYELKTHPRKSGMVELAGEPLPILREKHAMRTERGFYHALIQADIGRYANALDDMQPCIDTAPLVDLLRRTGQPQY